MEGTAIVRGVCRTPRSSARRRGSSAKPFKKRTTGFTHHGFLNHVFNPVWLFDGSQAVIERDFFNSLSNLCGYYNLKIPDSDGIPFPQNIYAVWKEVSANIEIIDSTHHCLIVAENEKKAVLAVGKSYGLQNDLFYIPVRTFWRWWNCPEKKALAELVLTLFSYLHQIVKVPFYQEHDSYMYGRYDTLYQWVTEEDTDNWDAEDKAFKDHQLDTLYELSQAGTHILRLLQDKAWLQKMDSIVASYCAANNAETEWIELAQEFVKLNKDFPTTALEDHVINDLHPADAERLMPYEYMSFFWSGKDCFVDELDDMLSCDFQEKEYVDEPCALHVFDQIPSANPFTFNFESRLFHLMERLRDLLSDNDHAKYN